MLKYCFILCLTTGISLASSLFGAGATGPKSSSSPGGQQPVQSKPSGPINFRQPPGPSLNVSTIFSSPGIATLEGDEWVGSEHLYNLPTAIGVVVEIVKPMPSGKSPLDVSVTVDGKTNPQPVTSPIALSEAKLKELVGASLKNVRMTVRDPLLENGTPLPYLHILVILHPVEKGYVAYCAARLFEAMPLNRVFLKSGIVFQAITWEKQELLITPSDQLASQVEQTVQTLVTSFVEKIKSYAFEKDKLNQR